VFYFQILDASLRKRRFVKMHIDESQLTHRCCDEVNFNRVFVRWVSKNVQLREYCKYRGLLIMFVSKMVNTFSNTYRFFSRMGRVFTVRDRSGQIWNVYAHRTLW